MPDNPSPSRQPSERRRFALVDKDALKALCSLIRCGAELHRAAEAVALAPGQLDDLLDRGGPEAAAIRRAQAYCAALMQRRVYDAANRPDWRAAMAVTNPPRARGTAAAAPTHTSLLLSTLDAEVVPGAPLYELVPAPPPAAERIVDRPSTIVSEPLDTAHSHLDGSAIVDRPPSIVSGPAPIIPSSPRPIIRLGLHPGQLAAWTSDRRFVFLLAGTQGGKTCFGPWWLAREIARCGPGDYLAVSATVDLAGLKMVPAIRQTFEWVLRAGEWRASDRTLLLYDPATGTFGPNGEPWGRIILRSAASDAGLESATARAAWLDECGQDGFTLETWEAIQRRLALHQGRVLGTTTPYNEGWLKSKVYDRWAAGDQRFEVIQFDSTLNPAFPHEEFERMRADMPGWRFEMFCRGRFEKPGGLVYDCFDPLVHVCEPFEIERYWPVEVGIDFGAVNTALIWIAHDKLNDLYYVFREALRGGLTTWEHAELVKQEGKGLKMECYWGGSPSEDQQRSDWCHEQVYVYQPPVDDVESGIDRVTRLFKEGRLKVFSTCEGLLAELGAYRRRLDGMGQPTDVIINRAAFHRLDALRYVVCGLGRGRAFYGPPIW